MDTIKWVYVVGEYQSGEPPQIAWDFIGVFDAEEDAAQVAMERGRSHFVAPVRMNIPFPHERTEWPGAYYPPKRHTDDTKTTDQG